jgi:hypothetical protein
MFALLASEWLAGFYSCLVHTSLSIIGEYEHLAPDIRALHRGVGSIFRKILYALWEKTVRLKFS